MICVLLTMLTLVALVEPNQTDVGPLNKLVPVMVTLVPPAAVAVEVDSPVTVGTGPVTEIVAVLGTQLTPSTVVKKVAVSLPLKLGGAQ